EDAHIWFDRLFARSERKWNVWEFGSDLADCFFGSKGVTNDGARLFVGGDVAQCTFHLVGSVEVVDLLVTDLAVCFGLFESGVDRAVPWFFKRSGKGTVEEWQ